MVSSNCAKSDNKIPALDLDITEPIDIKTSLKSFENNTQLYYKLLKDFHKFSVNE